MVRVPLCVQVVDGADLLSERTETEDKKLNKVCLLLFSSAPQFKASICSPVQASLQSLWPGPVDRASWWAHAVWQPCKPAAGCAGTGWFHEAECLMLAVCCSGTSLQHSRQLQAVYVSPSNGTCSLPPISASCCSCHVQLSFRQCTACAS